MTRFDGARRLADAALEATVVGSFSRIGFAARRALFDWDAEPVIDMSGRVALITGATGAEPVTSEEKAFLRQHPGFAVRATGTVPSAGAG